MHNPDFRVRRIMLLGFVAIATMYASSSAEAQQSYLRFQTGYSLGALEKNFFSMGIEDDQSGRKSNASLGQGFNVGAAYGFMFNEHLGLEMGLSYFQGTKHSTGDRRHELSARMVQFTPSLVLKAGFGKLDPFMRFGVVTGLGSVNYNFNLNSSDYQAQESWKYNGGLAVGISSGMGVTFTANDKWSLVAEMTFIGMSYAPTTGEMNASSVNGENNLSSRTTSDTQINFVETFTPYNFTNPVPIDPNKPRDVPRIQYPMSSFGLNLGVVYKF